MTAFKKTKIFLLLLCAVGLYVPSAVAQKNPLPFTSSFPTTNTLLLVNCQLARRSGSILRRSKSIPSMLSTTSDT